MYPKLLHIFSAAAAATATTTTSTTTTTTIAAAAIAAAAAATAAAGCYYYYYYYCENDFKAMFDDKFVYVNIVFFNLISKQCLMTNLCMLILCFLT